MIINFNNIDHELTLDELIKFKKDKMAVYDKDINNIVNQLSFPITNIFLGEPMNDNQVYFIKINNTDWVFSYSTNFNLYKNELFKHIKVGTTFYSSYFIISWNIDLFVKYLQKNNLPLTNDLNHLLKELITSEPRIIQNFYLKRNRKLIQEFKNNMKPFSCFLCNKMDTFTMINGEEYFEVHHFIPYNRLTLEFYKINLDVFNNLLILCPNCHRKIHFINSWERAEILKTIFINNLNIQKLFKENKINNKNFQELNVIYDYIFKLEKK